ncbi:MAG: futalosine hydrolase [Bacteroidales bacterium]|nr:futalosine hydrolase [Bacteroidales bacterium]
MKILLVSATPFEVKKLFERNESVVVIPDHLYHFRIDRMHVHLLTPGIGLLHTAFYLGNILAQGSYDLAINAGICGAYSRAIPLGSVLHVTEEALPEPGAEEDGLFRSVFELGLIPPDEYPFDEGKLVNTLIPRWKALNRLQVVTGNSINTMHTDPGRIHQLTTRFPADVESMEGAAFLFGCLVEKLPCAQIRAVSNYVGERDKSKWEVRLAVKNLDETLVELLKEAAGC